MVVCVCVRVCVCVCVCVCVERGGVKSETAQLQFMSGAPSLIGKENKEKNRTNHLGTGRSRTKHFAETNIAKRDSVWSFELVWQGNGLNQSQQRSTQDWVVPAPYHISLPNTRVVGLTAVLRETWCDLWLLNLPNIDSWWRNILLCKEPHFLLPTPTFYFKQDLFQERGHLGTKIYQTAPQPVPLSPARNSWNEAMQLFLFVRPWPIFSRLLYKTNPLPHFSLPLYKGKKQTDLPKLRQNTVHSQVGWKKDAAKLASTAPCPALFPEFQQQQQKCWTPPAPATTTLSTWKKELRCFCLDGIRTLKSEQEMWPPSLRALQTYQKQDLATFFKNKNSSKKLQVR